VKLKERDHERTKDIAWGSRLIYRDGYLLIPHIYSWTSSCMSFCLHK